MVEDISAFMAEFGTTGTLAGAAVTVIFDAPGRTAFGGAGIASVDPQATIATSSVPEAWLDAELVIPQGTYTVREHVPDGTGVSALVLSAAAA